MLTFHPEHGGHLSRAERVHRQAHVVALVRTARVHDPQSVVSQQHNPAGERDTRATINGSLEGGDSRLNGSTRDVQYLKEAAALLEYSQWTSDVTAT